MTRLYDVEFEKHSTNKIKYFGTLLKRDAGDPRTPVLVDFMAGKIDVENYCEISRILYNYKQDHGYAMVSMKEVAKQHLANTYPGYTIKRWYKTSNWLRHQKWFKPAKVIIVTTKANAFNVREYAERIGFDKVLVIPVTHTNVATTPGDYKDKQNDLIEPEWFTEVSNIESATDWLTDLGYMSNGRRAYHSLENMSESEFTLRYNLQKYGVALGFGFYPTIGMEHESSYTRTREEIEENKPLNQPVWVERIASIEVLKQFKTVYEFALDNGGIEAFADQGTAPCTVCGTYHKVGSAQCRVCNERFQEAEESLEELIETKRIRL